MGSKKLQIWLPVLFAMVMVLGMFLGYELKDKTGGRFMSSGSKNAIQEVMDLVRNKYVDKVKTDSITELAIDELLSHLDPHSVYIPAAELQTVNEDLAGNFQGIGVEFQVFADTVNVINVIKDGPSFKAGMQVGDKILKVNDTANLTGKKITTDGIRKNLRGAGGSKVKVSVLRGNEMKDLMITRGTIPVSTVDAAYIIAPQTGYIRINKFGERTYVEFMENLEKLQKQDMKKLILDLRGNGGGFLEKAQQIADEFLDNDKLVVYTEGTHSERKEYKCRREGLFETGNLVVLIDETSASASEILAGALQDWDRATIIGRRSFGKGLVQQQFELSDHSAVRLTVARYYTPLGRNIQKSYSNKTKAEYEADLIDRYHDGEVVHGDTSQPKGTAFKTPKGHVVYGGGGITPDYFIAADTARLQKDIAKLYTRATLSNFVYNYYMQNKTYFQNFKTPMEVAKSFKPADKEWQALQVFAIKDSIQLGNVSAKDKNDVLQRLQYMMARQLFRSEGYFEASNLNDDAIKKAIEILAK